MAKSEATLTLKIKAIGQEALKGVQDNMDVLKDAALGAFATISAVVIKAVHDFREQEIATQALTQAMVNNGVYSKALKDDYLAQAAAIQKVTLFGDEQVIQAQAAIQMAIGEQKVTKDLTLAVADLAQAKGMDLVSAAQAVAKTVGSNNNLLARQGIEFDNNTRGAERLAAVTQALNQKFGGQAMAATDGYGAIKQLTNSVSDLFETLGEKLLPLLSYAAKSMKEFAEDTNNTSPVMDVFVKAVEWTAVSLRFLFISAQVLATLIAGPLSTAVAVLSELLQGKFSEAFETVKGSWMNLNNEIKSIVEGGMKSITGILDAEANTRKAILDREEADLKQSLLNKAEAKKTQSEADFQQLMTDNQLKYDTEQANHALMLATQAQNDAQILAAKIAIQDNILKSHASHKAKLKAQEEKHNLTIQQMDAAAAAAKLAAQKDTFSLIAGLATSSNQTLAMIGKAAALTQIAIETPVAVSKALAAFPPPFNFVAAGAVGIAMGAQAAKVAGIPLAEGGIVQPRAGGVQATIAEAGQAEAVIPLDRAGEFGLGGGGHTFIFNGPVMGDERQAQEFAQAVDKELLKLRQNGGSVAFDTVV